MEFLRIASLYETLADYMRDLLYERSQKRRWWLISARPLDEGATGRQLGDIIISVIMISISAVIIVILIASRLSG